MCSAANKIELSVDDPNSLCLLMKQLDLSDIDAKIKVTQNGKVIYDSEKEKTKRELERVISNRPPTVRPIVVERVVEKPVFYERERKVEVPVYFQIEEKPFSRGRRVVVGETICGAKTVAGTPCQNSPDGRNKRCKVHFGKRAM